MNVREEERQKNTCPSRGLGLAAAAIGVGVGAALYYFFSKRPENPDGAGSTTPWNTEEPQSFGIPLQEDSDSYTTISEHSTSDTSMEETDTEDSDTNSEFSHTNSEFSNSYSESELNDLYFETPPHSDSSSNFMDNSQSYYSGIEITSDSEIRMEWDVTNSSINMPEDIRSPMGLFSNRFNSYSELDISSDSEINIEYDVTNSSINIPEDVRSPMGLFLNRLLRSPSLMPQRIRERSWSLEECSICFDVILKDQQVTTLPCTHHFHTDCIMPWLQEQTTCPNCRKSAE